jgi:hypothetical protein
MSGETNCGPTEAGRAGGEQPTTTETADAGTGEAGSRRWTPADLLWLLDGDWDVTTLANRVVATRTRGRAEVTVAHREGSYHVTARVDANAVGRHESPSLREALAGVRRDLRDAGV